MFIFVIDKREGDATPHVLLMQTPSKRGRKKAALSRVASVGGPRNDTLILTQLTPGGQVRVTTEGQRGVLYYKWVINFIFNYFNRLHLFSTTQGSHMSCQMKMITMAQKILLRHTGMVSSAVHPRYGYKHV